MFTMEHEQAGTFCDLFSGKYLIENEVLTQIHLSLRARLLTPQLQIVGRSALIRYHSHM
jgi:hypothetical protein